MDRAGSNVIIRKGSPFFIQKPPGCVQASVGFTTTLRCSASTGRTSKPTITWLKGKRQTTVIKESNRYLFLLDGSLKIKDVKKLDKGTYTCRASNGHKSKSAVVQFRPVTLEDVCGTVQEEDHGGEQEIGLIAGERVRRVVGGEPSHIRYWPWQVSTHEF